MTPVEEKSHAELGPSGWSTWSNCPGSIALGQGLPHTGSKYAREGTAAHSLLEDCLRDGFDAEDLLGRTYLVDGEAFTVDMEMADAVNTAIGWVRREVDVENGDILMLEQQVPIGHLTGEQLKHEVIDPRTGMPTGEWTTAYATGTADIVAICDGGKTLKVMDYKHGRGVQVWASDRIRIGEDPAGGDESEVFEYRVNGQLGMYALGSYATFSPIYDEIETVVVAIMQPRKEWFDRFELPLSDLLAFGDEVTQAAGRVELNRQAHEEGNNLDLVPGDKQCKFCKAKGICPALRNQVVATLANVADPSRAEDFEDLTLPKKVAAITIDGEVENGKLAEFMRAIPLLETAIKAVQAEVERRLFDGQTVPGFYLGEGKKGNRKWKDEQAALHELTKSGRLTMMEALERKPISPTKAEKLLKDRPRIWSQVVKHIGQAEGKPSVCREGDKNPPYRLPPANDFADLTIEETAVEIDPFG